MSALVESASFVWLLPVSRGGSFLHYLRRDTALGRTGPALCGELGPPDRYGAPKWRVVKAPSARVCTVCQAEACRKPTRIDWSGGPT